ncbi:ABC transporter permease [Nonomuraea sp. NPDC050663]|uniref:ABC transporter permease n=1 Tax=Nonomuraea sp. NPDC050663 TaxID=3364370 RepID=UPI003790F173
MIWHAVRLGLRRGLTETKHAFREPQEIFFTLFWSVSFLAVIYFQRDATIAGVSLAALTLPSLVTLGIAFNGLMGMVGGLSVEREDGTLLRAKSVPHGMVGYVIGKVVLISLSSLSGSMVVLLPSLFLVSALDSVGVAGWLGLFGILMLGLLATLPWGAVIGSFANSPQTAAGFSMLGLGGLAAVSGIFYPITSMPGWLQVVAQAFPPYWLGHGARAAVLPPDFAAAELTGAWRAEWAVLVLALWAAAGFLIAPGVLRRMARRESGSAMQARRERAMQRVG